MAQEGTILRFGRVTCVDDPHGGGRVQVRTKYDNPEKDNENLAWCIPLLPKMLYVLPKVGELVLVISMTVDGFYDFNYFIGPLISQEDKLYFEDEQQAFRITDAGYYDWCHNPRTKDGVLPTLYPATDDIAIEGRKDTGIQLKEEEVRIKAGVKVVGNNGPKNNVKSPSFISLKYYPENDYDTDGFMSTATIVADKINLIGTPDSAQDPATKQIPVTQNKDKDAEDQDNLISDSAMKELLNKAHQLPYGDKLIEFLDLLRVAFAKHVHPFPTMAPCNDENMKAVATYDLSGTLSNTVRIN